MEASTGTSVTVGGRDGEREATSGWLEVWVIAHWGHPSQSLNVHESHLEMVS